MEERVDQLVPYGYADVQIATFHAFGDRLIEETRSSSGSTPDFRVLTRAEQVIFLRDRLFELPLEHYRPLGDPTRHLQALIDASSAAPRTRTSRREEYRGPRRGAASPRPRTTRSATAAERHLELARTYAQYQALMARRGQVDFGDQIVETLCACCASARTCSRRYQRALHATSWSTSSRTRTTRSSSW